MMAILDLNLVNYPRVTGVLKDTLEAQVPMCRLVLGQRMLLRWYSFTPVNLHTATAPPAVKDYHVR